LINDFRPNSWQKLKIGWGRGQKEIAPTAPGIHGAGNPSRLLNLIGAGFKMGFWFVPALPRTKPGESQIPDQCSMVVPGQLVTEGIGLENGIVLSFSS
jgi:hypothetical protein